MDRDLPEQVERLPWDAPQLTQLDLDGTRLGRDPQAPFDGIYNGSS